MTTVVAVFVCLSPQVIHLYLGACVLLWHLVNAVQGDAVAQRSLMTTLPTHVSAVVSRIGDSKVGRDAFRCGVLWVVV
jgi:hypothetical protein